MKRYNPYTLPPWLRTLRGLGQQFIIPFCVFQGIRTIFLPTIFDVFLLLLLLFVAYGLHTEMI